MTIRIFQKTFMTAVLVISGMLVAQNAIATEITVQASKSAYVGKLQNGALLHGNRSYAYASVPKQVRGLEYILHDHKAASGLKVKVEKGGDICICACLTSSLLRRLDWAGNGRSPGLSVLLLSAPVQQSSIKLLSRAARSSH